MSLMIVCSPGESQLVCRKLLKDVNRHVLQLWTLHLRGNLEFCEEGLKHRIRNSG